MVDYHYRSQLVFFHIVPNLEQADRTYAGAIKIGQRRAHMNGCGRSDLTALPAWCSSVRSCCRWRRRRRTRAHWSRAVQVLLQYSSPTLSGGVTTLSSDEP